MEKIWSKSFFHVLSTKKVSAFTLAELMIIMSVMAVVLAAIAPIFTSRLTNMSFDNVWSNVGASNMNDIYSDAPIRSMTQQIIIGATPFDMEDVRKKYRPYSKLIIRSSNKVDDEKMQRQIEFKFEGNTLGYLFAANSNVLLGGIYKDINFEYQKPNVNNSASSALLTVGNGASGNTSMGAGALNSITTGDDNTAFGYNALSKLTTGSQNTAFGREAGSNLTTGKGNTLIGYHSYDAATGDYNTIIGNNLSSRSLESNYTTAVGNNINVKGNYNTAIGDNSNAGGTYNTAIGYNALSSENPDSDNYSSFQFNTAVGYNSCSGISPSAKSTTCIGGVGISNTMNSTARSLLNDSDINHTRVFIGRPASKYNSAATLEVHSLPNQTAHSSWPYPGSISGADKLGDSSVIVNGNLIVRGQTYMVGRSPFPLAPSATDSDLANTISLMGYRLYKESAQTHKPLIGMDGSEFLKRIKDGNGLNRQAYTAREHCICTYSCSKSSKDYKINNNYVGFRGRDSYDWSSLSTNGKRLIVVDRSIHNTTANQRSYYSSSDFCGSTYNVTDSAPTIELDSAHNRTTALFNGMDTVSSIPGSDKSCCPVLTPDGNQLVEETSSDIRLKNIISQYNYGIDKLSKLKVYDYYYITDKSKTPQVGVIAQDLRSVFPESVKKENDGYYRVTLEEIFYAAVNAVKQINDNLIKLTSKVYNYTARINNLKKENHELQNQLLILSKQLDELEK